MSNVYSQDEHFTRYDFAPTFFNPANTGNFYGSYRIGLLYREQFGSFFGGGSQYKTPTLFVDANFGLGFKKSDWTSFGITIISDKAGDLGLSSRGYLGSGAYHFSLDKKRRNILTLGVQFGQVSIGVDDDNANPESIIIDPNDADPIDLNDATGGYSDLNIGLMLSSNLGKTSKLEIGAAAGHVLNGEFKLDNSPSTNEVGLRVNAHAKLRFLASKGLALEPVIYFATMDQITNLQVQMNSAFLLSQEKEMALTAGLGYRVGDAAQVLLGMNYGLWKFGIAYDMTVSSATDATNYFGGFEIGASRIIYKYKKPKINPILLCPAM